MSLTTQVTIIGDDVRSVDATVDGQKLLVVPEHLEAAIGWKLEQQGLCRGDICVPVRDRAALFQGDRLDVEAVAGALGRLAVVDADAGMMALGADPATRKQALSLDAPEFMLDDLDGVAHRLSEWRSRKKLLFAFASW